MSTGILIRVVESWSVKLFTHLYLVPKLRMSGFTPLFPLYVFMVLTETNTPLIAGLQRINKLHAHTERKRGIDVKMIL